MSENLQFPIPNSVLEPYIKAAVSTAIVTCLGDGTKLVEAAVQRALMEKVDETGKKSNYDSYNKYNVVEVLATQKIQEITKQTVSEMAEAMRPQIKKAIESQLAKKHSQIATALVDSLIGSLTASWNVSVNIEPQKKDRY